MSTEDEELDLYTEDDVGPFATEEEYLEAEKNLSDSEMYYLLLGDKATQHENQEPPTYEERQRQIRAQSEPAFKYNAKTQPRDYRGRFRDVLARLKVDLGGAGSSAALNKLQEARTSEYLGDYARSTAAAGDLLGIIDRLDVGALNPESLENVREGSRQLGLAMATLPFGFGQPSEKIRYSDIPPAFRDLIETLMKKVEAKIGKEDSDIALKEMNSFKSGNDLFSQADIASQMSKFLRLLT